MWRAGLAFFVTAAVVAQTAGSRKVESYPAHASLGNVTLGAEFLVHAIPTANGSYFSKEYLVVDAAFFPALPARLDLSASHFTLRVDGKKNVILTQDPGMVIRSIESPEWTDRINPQLAGGAGIGDSTVIFGPRARTGRFPGDPTVRQPPISVPPAQTSHDGTEKTPPPPPDKQIEAAAMPETERSLPISGLLFFAYKGKAEKIKSVELIYDGPLGKTTLKLL
jgi:hypothetical protein